MSRCTGSSMPSAGRSSRGRLVSAEETVPARLLRAQRDMLLPLLARIPEPDFDRMTVCDGWSVRDVVAHCAAILLAAAARPDHGRSFTGPENAQDVEERRGWPLAEVLAELDRAYHVAATSPWVAPVALEEWIHVGDLREALGLPDAYTCPALPEALALLVERSVARGTPPVDVTLTDAADRRLDSAHVCLGDPAAEPVGWLRTDAAGLFRIAAGRRVGLVEREVIGVDVDRLRLFR